VINECTIDQELVEHCRSRQADTSFLVSTTASDCLERLVSEMTYYVSSWT